MGAGGLNAYPVRKPAQLFLIDGEVVTISIDVLHHKAQGDWQMITIKAWSNSNHLIEWNYDWQPEAWMIWEDITKTGRAPGSEEMLSRAYYWGPSRRKGEGPDRVWPLSARRLRDAGGCPLPT